LLVYTSVRMLEKHSNHCHFLPLFRGVRRSLEVEGTFCKPNAHNRMRTDGGVLRRFKSVVAVVPPRLPRQIAVVVHYALAPSFTPLEARFALPQESGRGSGETVGCVANGCSGDAPSRSEGRQWAGLWRYAPNARGLEGFVPLILAGQERASNVQNELRDRGNGVRADRGRAGVDVEFAAEWNGGTFRRGASERVGTECEIRGPKNVVNRKCIWA
jgi:hypothetical protein